MPGYVLDTDTCIYWLKGDKNIEGKVLEAGLDNISITVITECELFYGAFKSSKVEKNLKVITDLSKKIKIVQTMDGVSRIYGKIKSELERRGQILDDADLLIACITLVRDSTLVTNNTDHFKRIPGLAIENWRK